MRDYGLNQPTATALATSAEMESSLKPNSREKGDSRRGRGLFQLTDKGRQAQFLSWNNGIPIENATKDQQIRFAIHEITALGYERSQWLKARRVGPDSASLAAGYSDFNERPKYKLTDSADRYAVARAMDAIPVRPSW